MYICTAYCIVTNERNYCLGGDSHLSAYHSPSTTACCRWESCGWSGWSTNSILSSSVSSPSATSWGSEACEGVEWADVVWVCAVGGPVGMVLLSVMVTWSINWAMSFCWNLVLLPREPNVTVRISSSVARHNCSRYKTLVRTYNIIISPQKWALHI